MKSFWLFRSNLRPLEYYHEILKLEDFKQHCHDFWLLQGIWFLEKDQFDEVIIWRLKPNNYPMKDIVFNINGKLFIQKFVNNFDEVFKQPKAHTTMFRGGFPEYDEVTKKKPKHFGNKLYVGAGRRIYPQYGGVYDKILVEDESDLNPTMGTYPFYKTANQRIFKPLDREKKYDLCWVCNFKQITQKGQEWFIRTISKDPFLKSLKIVHVGNQPNTGGKLCNQYGVRNIKFIGQVDRPTLNEIINTSKFGIVTSNKKDGCPRIITEIMCAGVPLLIRKQTRLMNYYKHFGVMDFSDSGIEIQIAHTQYDYLQKGAIKNTQSRITIDEVCSRNLMTWGL